MPNFFGDPEMGMLGDEWMRQQMGQQTPAMAPTGAPTASGGTPAPGALQTPVAGQQSPYDTPSVNEASYWQKGLATQDAADRQKKMLAQMLMGQMMQQPQGTQTPLTTAANMASKYMMMNAFQGMK